MNHNPNFTILEKPSYNSYIPLSLLAAKIKVSFHWQKESKLKPV